MTCTRSQLIVLIVGVWLHGGTAWAQQTSSDETGSESKQGGTERTEKRPAPPLFPKHRRGLYVNADNIEVIDATPQSPPLSIDDPGVPDPGAWEINFTTALDFGAAIQRDDFLLEGGEIAIQRSPPHMA